MRKYFILLLILLLPMTAQAADTKASALTADASPGTDSILYTVDDPAGTPVSRRSTIAEVLIDGNIPNTITIDLATTVTTNADLTGEVTSTGNATLITESALQENGASELTGETLGTACSENEILKANASGGLDCAADAGGGGTSVTNMTLPVQSAKLTGVFVTHTPAGCGTTASTQGATIDAGGGPWKLLFDPTTDEGAIWQFVMPNNFSSAPIIDVHFAMASATALEVEFEASIMCNTPTTDTANIDTASFANCAVGTATTVSATAGEVYTQSITLTDDSCASGDDVFIWLSTDADDGTNDDATGDREVIGVEFSYTGS